MEQFSAPLLGEQRTAALAARESPSPCGWSWRGAPEGLLHFAELRTPSKKPGHPENFLDSRAAFCILFCLSPITSSSDR